MAAIASGAAPFARVFILPRDSEVASFESEGKSLLELSSSSPAPRALREWEIAL
jgi:hypothetical protein